MTQFKLVVCLGLTVSSSFVFADEAANLTKSMQSVMNKYCAAILKRDFKGADKVILENFAPDCKFTSQGQTLDLKGWMSMNNQQLKAMKSITKLTMKMGTFKIMGNKATGVESFAMVCTIPTGQAEKKTSVLSVTSSNTTTMQKRNGKWLCTAVSSKPGKVLIDGKPFDMSGAGQKKG